jgi:hypothetical protein
MINEQIVPCVADQFELMCVELFESLNCSIKRITEHEEAVAGIPIACIDAGSEDLEILLSLRIPVSVLSLTYPLQEDIVGMDDVILEDWLSELSNQLVGKMKRKLFVYGLELQIGLPNSYFGTDINEIIPEDFNSVYYYFDVDNEICCCTISVGIFNEDMVFERQESIPDDNSVESELELF